MPEYRNRGLAQKAIKLAEEKHGCSDWELDTILEEKGNCYHLIREMDELFMNLFPEIYSKESAA
jgi:hypothetical protein